MRAKYWTYPLFLTRGKFNLDAVAAEDRDLYLLMLAARWPDDIRGNRTYDHPAWHYINFPIKPVGQPDSVTTKPPADENILKALEQQAAVIRGTGPASEKAVALCWLLHLIGATWQPCPEEADSEAHRPGLSRTRGRRNHRPPAP